MAIPQTVNVEPSHKQVFETLRNFAEMVFSELGLTVAEIEKQSLPDLELSLATVRSAILRPDSFGTVQIKMTAETGMIMVNSKTESHLEMTILPILLERERLILKRIRALEEIHRLQDLKDVVENAMEYGPWNAKDIRDRLDKGIKAIQDAQIAVTEFEKKLSVAKADTNPVGETRPGSVGQGDDRSLRVIHPAGP